MINAIFSSHASLKWYAFFYLVFPDGHGGVAGSHAAVF